jgi:hypothetical protein
VPSGHVEVANGCGSSIFRPGQTPLTLASPVGTLRTDASRHQDECGGPIGSGDASRPPKARNHPFGTHRLALSARPSDDPVTNVAYILREPLRGPDHLLSPVVFADAHEEHMVVDSCDLSFRPAPSIDESRASLHRRSVDWRRPLQPSSVGVRLGKNHPPNGTEARKSSGRDPPRHLPLQPASRRPCRLSFVRGESAFATDGNVRSFFPRVLADCSFESQLEEQSPSTSSQGRHFVQSVRCWRRDLHSGGNIDEPQVLAHRVQQSIAGDGTRLSRLVAKVAFCSPDRQPPKNFATQMS